jgi:hypothetical protein
MNENFDQTYLDKIRNATVNIHVVRDLVSELAHKCSLLEAEIIKLKQNSDEPAQPID